MYEALKLFFTSFLLPPGGPIVLVVVGVLMLRSRPHAGRKLCVAGATLLWLACLPIMAGALVTALGGARPLDMAEARTADAIVILGGGVRAQAPEYGGDTLGRLTLERTRYGAHLARATALPVLVTGGTHEAGIRPEAELMREALVAEYGVPVQWVDRQARNTVENARNTAQLLQDGGRKRILLVMHGFDVRRTARQFKKEGLDVIPAPTLVQRWDDVELRDFLPSASALQTTHYASYELLALCRDLLVDWTSDSQRSGILP